ncbi:putative transcription factor interactor and regulator CCHC(Zn) family [Helianthus annuus]|uniref:Transcription factor interactor and regulator CCHC(Zn) family n=1 Tax=Helianthus annuus TaxID=4232 RepID=A0A9K3DY81_HELAN|nr:putative transcription factor interactor and regulator CCHC(Zn) family [Helianthus annuus]
MCNCRDCFVTDVMSSSSGVSGTLDPIAVDPDDPMPTDPEIYTSDTDSSDDDDFQPFALPDFGDDVQLADGILDGDLPLVEIPAPVPLAAFPMADLPLDYVSDDDIPLADISVVVPVVELPELEVLSDSSDSDSFESVASSTLHAVGLQRYPTDSDSDMAMSAASDHDFNLAEDLDHDFDLADDPDHEFQMFLHIRVGHVLQCNTALHLQNGQNFSEEVAKGHMALLVTVLESYESLVAGRIGNPMLTKEDYDQIDAEEMELMDIKWCLASVLRRAEKFKQITGRGDLRDANFSTLGFDKSKVTCFRCREKGHFKRECTNREAGGAQNPFGNSDYYQKAIYHQAAQQPSSFRAIEDGKKKACITIPDQEDERLLEGFSWDKYIPSESNSKFRAFIAQIIQEPELMKEWMDVFANDDKSQDEESVTSEDSSEKTTVFDQSSVDSSDDEEEINQINIGKTHLSIESFKFYFADKLEKLKERRATKEKKEVKCVNVAQDEKNEQSEEVKVAEKIIEKIVEELVTEKIENERIRRLLVDYSSSDYFIDRIYLTVAGFEAFQDKKSEDTNIGKQQSANYNKCPPPIWEGYFPRKPNKEQLKKAVNIKLKSETTDELLESIDVTFTSSDTDHESELIKNVVDQVLDKDEESESKSESESSSSSVDSSKSSVKRVYNKEFLLSKNNLNDEPIKVAYTLNDSDKLYSDEEFPIKNVKIENINTVFKLIKIEFSEIKDKMGFSKPKYNSRVQQRLNKKKGFGPGHQKKPNHKSNFKKKGLGFDVENNQNIKDFKSKTVFVSGSSSKEEKKSSFWKQSNKAFLAEKQKHEKNEANQKKETRTCYRCNEVGHIARNCSKATNTQQGVSSKLKEKVVDKTEPPTEKFKVFKSSTFEVGESSRRFYKRRANLNNQTWVAKKSDVKSGDESDSSKLDEPQVEPKSEKSVPPMDDVNFPQLRTENFKQKVGKVEISNQFYSEKKEFDVERAFNGRVKHIFGKMVEGRAKGVKEFYESKRTYLPSESNLGTPKAGQAWVSVFHA